MSIEVFFNRPARSLPLDRLCAEIERSTERLGVACAWFTLTNVADAIVASKAKQKYVIFSAADLGRNNGVGKRTFERIQAVSKKAGYRPDFIVTTLGSNDWQEGIMHNKFVVIDQSVVWTGSYNLTFQAAKNYETLMRIDDSAVADQFWRELQELAIQEEALWMGPTQFGMNDDIENGAFRCANCDKIKPLKDLAPGDANNSYMRCRLCAALQTGR